VKESIVGGRVVKILLIEDDVMIAESISLALQLCWPECQVVTGESGRKGIKLAMNEAPDIVILDLGLPDIDGFEVVEHIRRFASIPIIILTVRAEEADLVKALERGVDDYIVKPCGQLELLVRVRARIHDRARLGEKPPLSFGKLEFDPGTLKLKYGTRETVLNTIEANIINNLMRNRDQLTTYSSLVEEVWGADFPGSVRSLKVYIRSLRAKIEAATGGLQLIKGKADMGYFLVDPGDKDTVPPASY